MRDFGNSSNENWENRALPGPIDVPQEEALVQRGRDRLAAFATARWSMV